MTIGGVIPWMMRRSPSIRRWKFSTKQWKIPRRKRRRLREKIIHDRARSAKMEEDPQYIASSSPPPAADPALQAAMEDPVTVSLGPMAPLLRKLHAMGPQQRPPEDIRLLKMLCISLKNLSEDEDASCTAQWWMKIVRELCYDVEDHLDDGVSGAGADFSELLARVADANERRERFQWSPKTSMKHDDSGEAGDSSNCTLPPELPISICGRRMVGVVKPPNKLVDLLALDDDNKTLKVIPINGCAGIGKTTVARTLYHNYGGEFQCRAFVCVSQNPDVRRLLTSMLSQIKAPRPSGFPDVLDLIDAIRKHLHDKRYFIIIDDVWTASVWDIISPAFPCGDRCSRIITTTQINDVALACCSYDSDNIYNMDLVNDYESGQLFFGRVFGSEDGCPTDIKEIACEIVKKCGGLPLAIVNIASLLASESHIVRENWKHIQDVLCSTSGGIKVIVNLIYNRLPPSLRTCLLYLSMYPEGYVIKKGELVKHWVAEAFISAVEGLAAEKIAEGYFNELVSRGMVQAVDTDNNGEVLSCTVHQMVLDFIRCKSMEENFVITVNSSQSTLALADKVRRLSVQFGGVKSACIPESIITSQVRSFIFWGYLKCVPSIREYGLLRVLVLNIWAVTDNTSFDLTMIGQLYQLNYLKIEGNITVQLPDKIESLQQLVTLHVDARLYAVPQDLVNLERLLHLHLPSECCLPHGVANMKSLRSLGYFDLNSDSEENVLHLGHLTNLHDLQLTCSAVQPSAENLKKSVQLLGSVLEKLSVLQSVTLVPASGSSCAASISIPDDGFSMASPPPDLLLRRIELSRHCCIFFSLPRWFGELRQLCFLKIALKELSREDIDVLKGLPSLTALTVYIQTAPAQKIFIVKGGFTVLTYFKFMCVAPCLSFEQGGMARVQKLDLGFNANNMEPHTLTDAGFHYLTCLTEISVKFGAPTADEFDIKAAKTAVEAAVSNHPNIPVVRVQCADTIFYGEKDKSTKEKEDTSLNKRHDSREGKRKNTEGSVDTASEEKKEKALEERQVSQGGGKKNNMEILKGEISTKKEIEDTTLEKQHEIEEDKEEQTEYSDDESTAATQEEKNTKSSEQHVNKQVEGRMDGNTFQITRGLMDYYIPDYILKPEAEQVIIHNSPCCPVVVFINSISGGQLGSNLIKTYRELLNEAQVFDLSEESPDNVLHRLYANFEKLKSNGDTLAIEIQRNLRLIVAGGDGTASWLLGVVCDLNLSPSPPVATVPLGTGNNLPFSFGWGKKNPATDQDAVKSFLGLVKDARGMNIDSWQIMMRMRVSKEGPCDPIAPLEPPHSLHAFHRVSGSDLLNVEGHHTFGGRFWNYFSMGMDAQVSYGFHTERKKKPEKFKSLLTNLGTYAKLGRNGSLSSSRKISQLAKVMILKKPDGLWEELKIPNSIRSIICLNLPSFSGGLNPWGKPGTKKSQDRGLTPPYVDDGLIEVVGFRDAWHSLVLPAPNGHGTRLAQTHRIRFEFHKGAADHTFMGVDGEPWKQPLPNDDETVLVEISQLRQVTMLANHPCKSKSIDDPTSPSCPDHDNDDNDSLEDEDETG